MISSHNHAGKPSVDTWKLGLMGVHVLSTTYAFDIWDSSWNCSQHQREEQQQITKYQLTFGTIGLPSLPPFASTADVRSLYVSRSQVLSTSPSSAEVLYSVMRPSRPAT